MPEIIERNIYQKIKPHIAGSKAIVVTGVRRCGKTQLMRFIYETISSKNKIFLDLENPITRKDFEEINYDTILTHFQRLGIDLTYKSYVFLDEIQNVKSTPSIVKYLSDHFDIQFFLTGSASFYLKNLFSESLAGRKFIFEMTTLSFSEFLRFKKVNLKLPNKNDRVDKTFYETLKPYLNEYLKFGSFPEVVLESDPSKKELLIRDIFTSYFQKEVLQLSDFRKPNLVRDLIIILASESGSLVNIEKISNTLGVNRLTVEEWIAFLEGTYLITMVPPYSKNDIVSIRKAKKVYFVDWALAKSITEISKGQIFENVVFDQIKNYGDISYFRKKSGVEVDFIIRKRDPIKNITKTTAIEVKNHAVSQDVERIKTLSNELKIKKNFVVSQEFVDLEKVIYPFQF